MTFREIFEGILRHKAHPLLTADPDARRKVDEIEWALHALAERLAEQEESQ